MRTPPLTRLLVMLAFASGLTMAACGDDDDAGAGDVAAYCAISNELDESADAIPTDAQFDRLRAAAPAEIKDEVTKAISIFREHRAEIEAGDFSVFEDPDLTEAFTTIDAFEAANCDAPGS